MTVLLAQYEAMDTKNVFYYESIGQSKHAKTIHTQANLLVRESGM